MWCRSMSDRRYGLTRAKRTLDPATRQFVEQIAYGLRGGVVDIRDCAGVNDEPANRRRRAIHQGTHLVGEAVSISEKQIRTEAIDNKSLFGLLARCGGYGNPTASRVRRKHHGVRAITVADVPKNRKGNRQQDALFDADRNNRRSSDHREIKFPRAFAANIAQTRHIDHPHRYREHNARQHTARQVLKGAGEEQQHEEHDAGESQVRDLAGAPARSAIAVCVGLPLTTNAPLTAAAALATDSPRMSASSSTLS